MENIINIKSNWKTTLLEKQIKHLDTSQDMGRQAVFERALKAAQDTKDWKGIQASLPTQKKEENSAPVSFQLRYSDDDAPILKQIQADIMEQLPLERLRANFFWQLLLKNYLNILNTLRRQEQTKTALLPTKGAEGDTEIDSLSILHFLIEMMQSTPECAELEQISSLIINWRDKYIR